MTEPLTSLTGTIMRLDTDFIQVSPFMGFWLTEELSEDIHQRYKKGDTITITVETATGFVSKVQEENKA